MTDKNLSWFEIYLSDRMQYIYIGENSKTGLKYITRCVPQGSIPEPLSFLVYLKDLPTTSHLLDPVMFADNFNLLFNHKDNKNLLAVVNK